MNKENVICFPLETANFPFDLNLPLYLPIAARYDSTDEIGPGFDSTSPSITTCFRFKDERSYENSIWVGIVNLAKEVLTQIQRDMNLHDVKVDVKHSTIKPLHAGWIVDFYREMQLPTSKSIIKKGFEKALIRDADDRADALQACRDNPFLEAS